VLFVFCELTELELILVTAAIIMLDYKMYIFILCSRALSWVRWSAMMYRLHCRTSLIIWNLLSTGSLLLLLMGLSCTLETAMDSWVKWRISLSLIIRKRYSAGFLASANADFFLTIRCLVWCGIV